MKRKIIVAGLCLMMAAGRGFAQDRMPGRVNTYTDEGTGTGFRKENLFIGGSLGLGFAADQFSVGVNPEVGYSLNRWVDVGAVVNFTYNSVSPDPSGYYNPDLSEKEFIYGGGLFGRVYFLPFLFVTAQPEFNWTHDRQVYEASGGATYTYDVSAPSLLVGLGYGRRMIGQGTFWIAVMFDVAGNPNSPYNDIYGHPEPVIRAGFDLFPHKRY
ncbi:MAG TPA: hypothetical protein VL978_18225 [Puia sp.]|nr:hypothetical protein [Puia sp.]